MNLLTLVALSVLSVATGARPAFEQAAPSQTTAGMVAASAELARPLGVGDRIPDANLRDVKGRGRRLSRILDGRPAVLVFYRGGWCPYCNMQLSGLQSINQQLEGLGYQLIAITPDRPEELRKTGDLHNLTYSLYSDSTAEALKAFGVAWKVPDDQVVAMRDKFGVDLEKSSGTSSHILPVPTVFIVDKTGKIRFVYSNADYKVRLAPAKTLAAARDALNN